MTSTVGRLVVDVQTNKSGGAVAYGDVVISDTANDHSFTTTTTSGYTAGVVGVCIEPNGIANNATGRIQFQGYCPQVNAAASVTRGYFLKTHTVAKQATSSSTRVAGAFGVALKTSSTPDAILWGFPDNAGASGETVATSAIWDAAGDLAVGSGADTAARLAIGAAGTILRSTGSTAAWQGAGLIDFDQTRNTAGNKTCNSTTWTNLDTGMDLVLTAAAGDIVEVNLAGLWENQNVSGYLDVATWVSGAGVHWFGSGEVTSSTGNGIIGVAKAIASTNYKEASATVAIALVSGDISAGTVTLRIRYRTGSASNLTLRATSADPLTFQAKVWRA